jgi:hypothetical protein
MATVEEIKRFFVTFITTRITELAGENPIRTTGSFPDLTVASYPLCVVDLSSKVQKRDYLYPYGSNWRGLVSFSIIDRDTLSVDQLSDKLNGYLFSDEKQFVGFRSRGIVDESPVYSRQIMNGQELIRVFQRDIILDIAWYQGRT